MYGYGLLLVCLQLLDCELLGISLYELGLWVCVRCVCFSWCWGLIGWLSLSFVVSDLGLRIL